MQLRVILFDIDGTLILTGGAGILALRKVFSERFGVDDAVQGLDFHGATDPLILDAIARNHLGRALDSREEAEVIRDYLRYLTLSLQETSFRVLDGAPEIVEDLAQTEDVILGLATGNFEPAAWTKLRRAGLDAFFGFGGFGSDHPDRDELTRIAADLGRERAGDPDVPVIVVGDTVRDVRSARAAGADCLAVTTGNADAKTLTAEGARWVVPTLSDPEVRRILSPG